MRLDDMAIWGPLRQASPWAFIIGGAGLLLEVLSRILESAVSMTRPGELSLLFGVGGLWVVSIGLLGVYPVVVKENRWLSSIGLMTGALGWVAITALAISLDPLVFSGGVVLLLLSLLAYGIAGYRTDTPSKTAGLLLLLPCLGFLGMVLIAVVRTVFAIESLGNVSLLFFGVASASLVAYGISLQFDIGEQKRGEL